MAYTIGGMGGLLEDERPIADGWVKKKIRDGWLICLYRAWVGTYEDGHWAVYRGMGGYKGRLVNYRGMGGYRAMGD